MWFFRHATNSAERDDKRYKSDGQKQRLAHRRQKNSDTQNYGDDQINQNGQSKFHRGVSIKIFPVRARIFGNGPF